MLKRDLLYLAIFAAEGENVPFYTKELITISKKNLFSEYAFALSSKNGKAQNRPSFSLNPCCRSEVVTQVMFHEGTGHILPFVMDINKHLAL